MIQKKRSVPVAVKCALLSLVFAVLGMGINARLTLGRANGASPNEAAKLSIEERSVQSLLPLEKEPKRHISATEELWFSLAPLFQGNRFHYSHSGEAELSLCTPCRYDSFGPDQMHLPPPTHS